MNQHQQINGEFERQYAMLDGAIIISPSALAHRVFEQFSTGEESPGIAYAGLEHLKHMARVFLARRKDADGDLNDAHGAQAEMDLGTSFSNKLQDRYPLPRKDGEEACYKLRSQLTMEERAWNANQLRKSARARMEHADALEAEGLAQIGGAA